MTSFVTSTTTIAAAAAAAATTFPWQLTTSHPCWDGLRSHVQRVNIVSVVLFTVLLQSVYDDDRLVLCVDSVTVQNRVTFSQLMRLW